MMAKITFKAGDEFAVKLSRLAEQSDEVAKKALYAGADIVADQVRDRIAALPEESFRHLQTGDSFQNLPERHRQDLLDSLGITPILRDKTGYWSVKVGFDGYGSFPTKTYPRGLPNRLLARSIESGSSVRRKIPFVAPAIKAVRKTVVDQMNLIIEIEFEKMMKG